MRIGISQENESQKCTETTVEDGWSDGRNCRRGPLILGSCLDHERVGNVGCVIDTQANGQHQIDARNCVDRQSPEMHRAVDTHLRTINALQFDGISSDPANSINSIKSELVCDKTHQRQNNANKH